MNNEIKNSMNELVRMLETKAIITGDAQSVFLFNSINLLFDVSENELHSQIFAQKMIEFIEKINFVEGNIPLAIHLVTECNTPQN
jgi:hypothetical protein